MGHAANERILVSLFGEAGEKRAELNSVHVGGDRLYEVPHVIVARFRFWVPRIVVGHTTPKKYLDDRFGLALEDWRRGAFRWRRRGCRGISAQGWPAK